MLRYTEPSPYRWHDMLDRVKKEVPIAVVGGNASVSNGRWLDVALPVSVVLGGGGIRGLAHLGAIEALSDSGYRIEEMIGTSVGGLVTAFYAVVGLDVPAMRSAGLAVRSSHLLVWALHRRAPAWIQRRWRAGTGVIPEYLDQLTAASFGHLHHGVRRVGILARDVASGRDIVCHSDDPIVSVADIVRGSVAIPGLFPPRRCITADGELLLADGARILPVDALFRPPFEPRQLLVVDICTGRAEREAHTREIDRLRTMHPAIPIAVVRPELLVKATVIYRRRELSALVESGRRAAREVIPSVAASKR
jgi:predicted acylesterase/phospholipase RssA